MNMAYYDQIQALILKLRELDQLPEQIAGDIAPEIKKALEKNISSSLDPDGSPWEPTIDGSAPLQNASNALGVASIGSKVLIVLRGIEARHNFGNVRGGKKRKIIPDKITEQILKIINDVVSRRFNMIMGK